MNTHTNNSANKPFTVKGKLGQIKKPSAGEIALAGLLFAAFIVLALIVSFHPINELDIEFSHLLQSQGWAALFAVTNGIFSEIGFRITCFILLGLFMSRKRYDLAAFFAVAAVIEIISVAIKYITQRPRPSAGLGITPSDLESFSFVSGHTLEYSFLYWVLAAIVLTSRPKGRYHYAIATVLALIPIVVGLGRIYVGDHWLTDVIGSFLVSGALVVLILRPLNLIGRERSSQ